MELVYFYAVISVICFGIVIWARRELRKTGHQKE